MPDRCLCKQLSWCPILMNSAAAGHTVASTAGDAAGSVPLSLAWQSLAQASHFPLLQRDGDRRGGGAAHQREVAARLIGSKPPWKGWPAEPTACAVGGPVWSVVGHQVSAGCKLSLPGLSAAQ